MGWLKRIAKEIKRETKDAFKTADKAFISGPYDWMKDHKKELAAYSAIVGGGALGGWALSGLGTGAAGGTAAAGGATAKAAAGAAAAAGGKMASESLWPYMAASMGMNAAGSYLSQKSAKEAVQQQIAWERERATNAHQWEVQDLIHAGLNPILSAGGSGAVTGGISAPLPDYSQLGNSAAEAIRIKNERQSLKNETLQTLSNIALNNKNANLIEEQTAQTAANASKARAEAALAQKQLAAETPRLEVKQKYNKSWFGHGMGYLKNFTDDAGDAIIGAVGLGGAARILKGATSAKAVANAEKQIFNKTHYVEKYKGGLKKVPGDNNKYYLPRIYK